MSIRPGKAVWFTKDYDYPVEVVRYLGTTDGVRYYLVRSDQGETGVPEHELKQELTVSDYFDEIVSWLRGVL